jgi:hypothetical protein
VAWAGSSRSFAGLGRALRAYSSALRERASPSVRSTSLRPGAVILVQYLIRCQVAGLLEMIPKKAVLQIWLTDYVLDDKTDASRQSDLDVFRGKMRRDRKYWL